VLIFVLPCIEKTPVDPPPSIDERLRSVLRFSEQWGMLVGGYQLVNLSFSSFFLPFGSDKRSCNLNKRELHVLTQ
jgi:hypothetical protein